MQTAIVKHWNGWLWGRRRRLAARHLQKRAVILQHGLQLYVQVLDAQPTRTTIAKQRLVRLQLHIQLLNNTCLRAASLAFLQGDCTHLKGQYVRIRFLPGDLSHVVVIL